jgi:hypothetical protein
MPNSKLAELIRIEGNPSALKGRLAPGCVYNKTEEGKEYRVGPNGQSQYRVQTCREVTGCTDPSYNVPKDCSWGDWTDT